MYIPEINSKLKLNGGKKKKDDILCANNSVSIVLKVSTVHTVIGLSHIEIPHIGLFSHSPSYKHLLIHYSMTI